MSYSKRSPRNNSSEDRWEEVTKGGKISKVNRVSLFEPGKGSIFGGILYVYVHYCSCYKVPRKCLRFFHRVVMLYALLNVGMEGYSSLVSEIFGGQLRSELRARRNKYEVL